MSATASPDQKETGGYQLYTVCSFVGCETAYHRLKLYYKIETLIFKMFKLERLAGVVNQAG